MCIFSVTQLEAVSKRTLMVAEGRSGAGSFLSKGPCSLTLEKGEVSLMKEARSFAQAGRGRGYRGGYRGQRGYRGGRGGYRGGYQSHGGRSDLETVLARVLQSGGAGSQSTRGYGGSSKALRCFKCNESNHLAKTCPN